jgi:HSP20 family protein
MRFLERWRPLTDLERFRSEFDDLLARFGLERDWFGRWPFDRRFFGEGEPIAARPAIESRVEEGKFIVRVDLPGIDPKNVEIKAIGDVLTIKGSREEKRESKQVDYFRREIRYGAFECSIRLPGGIKAEDLKATYRDGVLEVSAPMPKEAAPKEVKIQIESPQQPAEIKAKAA